ncbi:Gfo/Idh/MocA family protein [Listeria kieliensis]|uniref:Oxidoreductase n=1 Tax=Listeria kieliensis TaxID=1621700 RepID=A0A3D8TUX9_9LIST|nr:Gfo/Idh/MocA family oxidoreductase [Listeria kieliensis]RDX02457.1 oxidoreductase [Listeria kieliensis]
MKVAIVGLGGIAQKAYLPVFAEMEELEVHLYTRNLEKLKHLQKKYRFKETHTSIESVIEAGVEAVFVHSSTQSHAEMIKPFIEARIAVYVDKPISDQIEETRELTALAERLQVPLMTGFNRRFAPYYQELKQLENANMIVMQKNRADSMGEPRTFIYDDFIHVVDTIRFLLDGKVEAFQIFPVFREGLLESLTVQFSGNEKVATAIMNRNSGVSEEKVEVLTSTGKYTVSNLQEIEAGTGIVKRLERFPDWEKTLYKRGFVQIVSAFLEAVKNGQKLPIAEQDALSTHELCEEILNAL